MPPTDEKVSHKLCQIWHKPVLWWHKPGGFLKNGNLRLAFGALTSIVLFLCLVEAMLRAKAAVGAVERLGYGTVGALKGPRSPDAGVALSAAE